MKLGAFTGQQQKKSFCGVVTEMRANEIVALYPITILLFQQYVCFCLSSTYSACVFNKTSTPTPSSLK